MKFRFYCCLVVLLFPALAWADMSALIIQGVGGSETIEKKLEKWGTSTRDVLVQDLGFAKDRVILLAGDSTRKASVEQAFTQLKQQIKKDDNFLLILIGHGSFDTDYKLNIMGPDITGKEYVALIDSLGANRAVVISSTSSSGGMFETMGGKNRVLVAASRSGEKEDTVFYEHFLQGLKGLAADEDKDKKVSVWEAFKYATSGVERFYKEQTRIMTEHAGLAAGGAAQVAATAAEQDAPVLARVTSLSADRTVTVADPKLQALLNERKAIELEIEKLRLDKNLLSEAEYEKRLEEMIVRLARKNQEIQEQQKR
ncbi:MAG TPA: hypothetical protein VFE29_06555 [Terriglobia bacterium]|nr:hypothetical protein [Terriglobia bacterium]